jgi:hypothetical protein
MALQSDAIESRLEGLKFDDRRTMYDSKLRTGRRESKSHIPPNHLSPQAARIVEPDQPIEQVLLMLDELSRRIEGLERKNQSLGHEIRHRRRQDNRWRSTSVIAVLAIPVLLYMGRHLQWF